MWVYIYRRDWREYFFLESSCSWSDNDSKPTIVSSYMVAIVSVSCKPTTDLWSLDILAQQLYFWRLFVRTLLLQRKKESRFLWTKRKNFYFKLTDYVSLKNWSNDHENCANDRVTLRSWFYSSETTSDEIFENNKKSQAISCWYVFLCYALHPTIVTVLKILQNNLAKNYNSMNSDI